MKIPYPEFEVGAVVFTKITDSNFYMMYSAEVKRAAFCPQIKRWKYWLDGQENFYTEEELARFFLSED